MQTSPSSPPGAATPNGAQQHDLPKPADDRGRGRGRGRGRPRTLVAPCAFCNKQFKRQEHLQRHERIHTQEKPFVCACNQRFARQDLLVRHHKLSRNCGLPQQPDAERVQPGNVLSHPSNADFPSSVQSKDGDSASRADNELHDDTNITLSTAQPCGGESSFTMQLLPSTDPTPPPPILSETNLDDDLVFSTLAPAIQAADDGAAHDFLLGSAMDTGQYDFLWNDVFSMEHPLPVGFTNTDFSLVDLSERYAGQQTPAAHAEAHTLGASYIAQPSNGAADAHDNLGTSSRQVVHPPGTLASRLPSLEPSMPSGTTGPTQGPPDSRHLPSLHVPKPCPWTLSLEGYQQLGREIDNVRHLLPANLTMPSRHAMTRYLEGYFRGFHTHLPLFHVPTLSADNLGLSLVLSITAMGALYRFEHAKGFELFRAARALAFWQLAHVNDSAFPRLTTTSPDYTGFAHQMDGSNAVPPARPRFGRADANHSQRHVPKNLDLRLLQCLVILAAMASWGDRALMRDAISMSSQVAMLVREFGIGVPEPLQPSASWNDWIKGEERRRTLLIAYIIFNLQCIAFDVTPQILNAEVAVHLPSSEAEWGAPNEHEWNQIRAVEPLTVQPFQQALSSLSGQDEFDNGAVSAFGNYVLIQAIFQQTFHARNATSLLASARNAVNAEFVRKIEISLRLWQKSWDATRESTLDPSSPKGPLGFNSTALLRLIHIRLAANTGPSRCMISRDPSEIAQAFTNGEIYVCDRSPHLDRAVLQCIHALSVPIRVGIAYVTRTQTFNWSIQHSLCNLECAFLLAHWCKVIAADVSVSGIECLRPDELKLFDMLANLVKETDMAYLLNETQIHTSRIRRLSAIVIRLWAETFKGFQVFDVVHMIGTALSSVADILATEYD